MTLKLNREIYPAKAVKKAIGLYRGIVKLHVKKSGPYFFLSGSTDKENEELVKNEFLNFVLGLVRQ